MTRFGIPILLAASLVLAACGSDDTVSVADAWARASAPGQTQGAIYFDLTVAEDDRLVGAAVPASIAAAAEIHEVVMDDAGAEEGSHDMDTTDGEMSEMDAEMSEMDSEMSDMDTAGSGMMRMQELPDGLALTGGETVSFEPGSFHVMLPALEQPLVAGEEFELTLEFAETDAVTVTVQIADSAP